MDIETTSFTPVAPIAHWDKKTYRRVVSESWICLLSSEHQPLRIGINLDVCPDLCPLLACHSNYFRSTLTESDRIIQLRSFLSELNLPIFDLSMPIAHPELHNVDYPPLSVYASIYCLGQHSLETYTDSEISNEEIETFFQTLAPGSDLLNHFNNRTPPARIPYKHYIEFFEMADQAYGDRPGIMVPDVKHAHYVVKASLTSNHMTLAQLTSFLLTGQFFSITEPSGYHYYPWSQEAIDRQLNLLCQKLLTDLVSCPQPHLQCTNVPGHGDCLFLAFSYAMAPTSTTVESAHKLRTDIVSLLANVPAKHPIRADDIWDTIQVFTTPEHIALLRDSMVWNNDLMDLMPVILCYHFNVSLVILRCDQAPVFHGGHSATMIYLLYDNIHYKVITTLDIPTKLVRDVHASLGIVRSFMSKRDISPVVAKDIKRLKPLQPKSAALDTTSSTDSPLTPTLLLSRQPAMDPCLLSSSLPIVSSRRLLVSGIPEERYRKFEDSINFHIQTELFHHNITVESICSTPIFSRLQRISLVVTLPAFQDFCFPEDRTSIYRHSLITFESSTYNRMEWAKAFEDKLPDPPGTSTDIYVVQVLSPEFSSPLNASWRTISDFRGASAQLQILTYQIAILQEYIMSLRFASVFVLAFPVVYKHKVRGKAQKSQTHLDVHLILLLSDPSVPLGPYIESVLSPFAANTMHYRGLTGILQRRLDNFPVSFPQRFERFNPAILLPDVGGSDITPERLLSLVPAAARPYIAAIIHFDQTDRFSMIPVLKSSRAGSAPSRGFLYILNLNRVYQTFPSVTQEIISTALVSAGIVEGSTVRLVSALPCPGNTLLTELIPINLPDERLRLLQTHTANPVMPVATGHCLSSFSFPVVTPFFPYRTSTACWPCHRSSGPVQPRACPYRPSHPSQIGLEVSKSIPCLSCAFCGCWLPGHHCHYRAAHGADHPQSRAYRRQPLRDLSTPCCPGPNWRPSRSPRLALARSSLNPLVISLLLLNLLALRYLAFRPLSTVLSLSHNFLITVKFAVNHFLFSDVHLGAVLLDDPP
jgi:hypothetical protein